MNTKNLIFIFSIISLIGCKTTTNKDFKNEAIIPDTLFFEQSIKSVDSKLIKIDDNGEITLLRELNDNYRNQITDYIKPLSDYKPQYEAYFYAKLKMINNILPIIIYARADAYGSMILITLKENKEVIDNIELTSDICDLIDQDDEKEVIWCENKKSEFVDDTSFNVFMNTTYTNDYGTHTTATIDSITYKYVIEPTGKIKMNTKDSVRIER